MHVGNIWNLNMVHNNLYYDIQYTIEAWLSLVERTVRDGEVESSNLFASIPWQGRRHMIHAV